jgi:MIP family channel proteins
VRLTQQVIAEFVGTLALVFIAAGSVVVLNPAQTGPAGTVGVALAQGLVLAIFVSNLAFVSGAHYNPAVTIGIWVSGKIETPRALIYIITQLAGAAAGAALLAWAVPKDIWTGTNLGTPALNTLAGITAGRGVILEAVLTFFLMFTIYAVAVDSRGVFKAVAGLTIGLVLTMDILVGGALTGAAMNPARAFGPALVSGDWTDYWVYVAGPLIGAILAAGLYYLTLLRQPEVTPIASGGVETLEEVGE